MDFLAAFNELLKHEGGFVDHPSDPGGATRYGITENVARANGYRGEMQELPLELAQSIYRRSYWDAVRADELPAGIRYAVFDAAVNSGVVQAIRWLQRAVGVHEDGRIGPQTLASVRVAPTDQTIRRMLGFRLDAMTRMKGWPAFSRGWASRVSALLRS